MGISFIGIEGNRDGYSPDQCAETCTVRELIDALEYFDDDMPVYLINDNGYTYGSISARDIDEHFVNNDGDLDEEDYEEQYTRKHTIEDYSGKTPELNDNYDWANYLTKALNLNSYDSETLLHDLNNLRADEWLDDIVSANVPYGIIDEYKKFFHIDDDGDLDGEEDEDDLVLHISESVSKNDVKTVMRAAAHVNTFADLESVMSSLLTIDRDLYKHYAEMLRRTKDFVSPASLGKDISDDLYWKLQAEFDVDDEFNADECYKSHMHESHKVRKNKLCIKRTHKHPKLMK